MAKTIRHEDLVERIRKTCYYGRFGDQADNSVEEKLTLPLASYASELFSKSHHGYSLNRLSTYNAAKIQANPCSLIMAVIFLERLNAEGVSDPSYLHRITPQELFIVSMMISTKFYVGHDEEIYLSDWAAEGNMTDERLKQLELEFLCAIDWNIYISNQEFFDKLESVEKILASRQGIPRGWLTYTEVVSLLPSIEESTVLLNAILNHLAVLMFSYAAGVLTIVGAFFLASNVPGHALHRSVPSTVTVDKNFAQLGGKNHVDLNSTTVTTVLNENSTCCAINTEAELIKLEHQYQEEQNRHRNNEIDRHALNLLLPVKLMSQSRGWASSKKSQHKWLTFKEMYSENSCSSDAKNLYRDNMQTNSSLWHPDIFENFTNITNSLQMFWQMLADNANKPSIVRLPNVWFKFI